MPGTAVAEAVAVVAGELPDIPHLPELPARGPGADMVGRTAALLAAVSADLAVETTPTGWRFAGGGTHQVRRALSWLGEDLDRCEEVFGSSHGWFKVQLCGPWTMAAAVEAPSGGPALKDAGLVADIGAALAEAAALHIADVSRRLSARTVLLQIDEPALPAVLSGRIESASGFAMLPAVGAGEAARLLRHVRESAAVAAILHCCAEFPFDAARAAGFPGFSWDLALTPDPVDPVAEAFEAGIRLVVGVVPTSGPADLEADWRRLARFWRRTGFAESGLAELALSPACGLAGASPQQARAALVETAALAARAAEGTVGRVP